MRRILIGALASASALAITAYGASAQAADTTAVGEVVVTGTLIHGLAPTGAEVSTVTGADLTQLGVVDTSQLLGSLPQDSNFNSRPQVGNYGQYQSVNAPVLRYLGGGNTNGSAPTLLLVDGVRLPGMGIQQSAPDIDAIAPGALARVDVAPDGGSATYGSDAVGGVVNLITRRSFDGVQIGGHFGAAANYGQYDLNLTAGKIWDKGSVWISYDYTEHNSLQNYDRDYIHDLNYKTTPITGNSAACYSGNFQVGGKVYPIVNGVPVAGNPNTCDVSGSATFFPSDSRHSVMVGFDYDVAPWLTFDLRSYYMHREATNDQQANGYTSLAYTGPVMGVPMTGNVTGLFNDAGFNNRGVTTTDAYGVIPRFKAKLWYGWQMDAFVNVAEGKASFQGQYADGDKTSLAAEAASGAFNPFMGRFANTAAGQTAAAYQAGYDAYSTGKDDIVNSRIVFDGPLFALPGGEVKAAVGGEYYHEEFTAASGTAEVGTFGSIALNTDSRSVESGFFEVNVPIVGEQNNVPLINSLTVTGAGRYDNYSDFGGTFNPKVGVAWKPLNWWTLRGDWGTSFQAPALSEQPAIVPTTLEILPRGLFGTVPGSPPTAIQQVKLLLFPGNAPNLKPQTATTWEIGTDIRPPAIPGLSASATYYNVSFVNQLHLPDFFEPAFYTNFPNNYTVNTTAAPLTSAEVAKFISGTIGAAQAAQYVANPSTVYLLESALTSNAASTTTSGLDFNVNYTRPTDFGSVFGGVAGTYLFTFTTKNYTGAKDTDLNHNAVSRLHMSTTLGAKWSDVHGGDLLAKATWNVTGAYDTAGALGLGQTHVAMFSVVNLAFVYTPKAAEGPLKGASFTLNVDNLLDTNPPFYNGIAGNAYGYSGFTLGRLFEIGATKKF